MNAQLAMNIAAGLSKVIPEEAALYFKNAKAYADTMNKLADEMAALGARVKNNRIVQPHGAFDYLARDMGLEIVAVMQPHGQEPSASEMGQLVKTIKDKSVGAIFTEPQYPEKIGKTLAKETGIPVATLDPVATGPENASPDYYENVMRQNMKILEATLGTK
jgi:ABC-type Zn uptake system ZnuABC Zn-binding protein ZnuA